MPHRINLSIDSDLFEKIQKDAKEESTSENLLIIDLLGRFYGTSAFNFSEALKELVEKAEEFAKNHQGYFTLSDLPSFSEICVVRAEKAKIKPSTVMARLGKMFNAMVERDEVDGVIRAKDNNGKLKYRERAAVYTNSYTIEDYEADFLPNLSPEEKEEVFDKFD